MHEAPGSIIIMKKKARRIFQFWPQTDENQGVASQVTYKFSLLFIFIFFSVAVINTLKKNKQGHQTQSLVLHFFQQVSSS